MRRKADAQRGVLPASAHGGGQSRVQAPSALPDGDASQQALTSSAAHASADQDAMRMNGASIPSPAPASVSARAPVSPAHDASGALQEARLSTAQFGAAKVADDPLPGIIALAAGCAAAPASVSWLTYVLHLRPCSADFRAMRIRCRRAAGSPSPEDGNLLSSDADVCSHFRPATDGTDAVELAEARAERSMQRLASMLGPDGGLADASFSGAKHSTGRMILSASDSEQQTANMCSSVLTLHLWRCGRAFDGGHAGRAERAGAAGGDRGGAGDA